MKHFWWKIKIWSVIFLMKKDISKALTLKFWAWGQNYVIEYIPLSAPFCGQLFLLFDFFKNQFLLFLEYEFQVNLHFKSFGYITSELTFKKVHSRFCKLFRALEFLAGSNDIVDFSKNQILLLFNYGFQSNMTIKTSLFISIVSTYKYLNALNLSQFCHAWQFESVRFTITFKIDTNRSLWKFETKKIEGWLLFE